MTYKELKESLKYLLAGGSALHKNEEAVSAFYKKAVTAVLSHAEPLTLITCDRERFETHRPLDSTYFIRRPEIPEEDSDSVDMDLELIDAVINYMAGYMADIKHRNAFCTEAQAVIDAYMSADHSFIQSAGFYERFNDGIFTEERTDIPVRLDEKGLLKYYLPVQGIDDWQYQWDRSTVELLDKFMLDFDGSKFTPSQRALWNQFLLWQDGEDDAEAKALKSLDDIYLQRCG